MGATDGLSCGVPDRESNDARYLQEALDMTEEFHRGGSSQGTTELTLEERQVRPRSEACGIRQHLGRVPKKKTGSLVEDGSGSV